MKIERLEIHDIVLCTPNAIKDFRGSFSESFRKDKLNKFLGYSIDFCQENETVSSFGVIRGLHFQQAPHGQTKLVRVVKGRVLDIVLDIRKKSKTFGKHISVELSAENKKQLLIPPGFAHGFVTLSDEATFLYKVDKYYNSESERGILFSDKDLAIDWKLKFEQLLFSEKDANQPNFKNA